ncbi:MAG TPA: hypothetical protein VG944_13210 [Fimbriimonas sp.]|nr:hypothetical protein [Fimbriimonas sp.]
MPTENLMHSPVADPSPAMSREEVEQVVRRLHDRSVGEAGQATASDVAEALRLPEREVLDVLRQIRGEQRLSKEARQGRKREARIWLMTFFLGLLLTVALIGAGSAISRAHYRHRTSLNLPPPTPLPPAESAAPQGPLKFTMDGQTAISQSGDVDVNEFSQRALTQFDRSFYKNRTRSHLTEAEDQRILNNTPDGSLDVPGIQFEPVYLDQYRGHDVPLQNLSLPYYMGTSGTVDKEVRNERLNRLKLMLLGKIHEAPTPAGNL